MPDFTGRFSKSDNSRRKRRVGANVLLHHRRRCLDCAKLALDPANRRDAEASSRTPTMYFVCLTNDGQDLAPGILVRQGLGFPWKTMILALVGCRILGGGVTQGRDLLASKLQ